MPQKSKEPLSFPEWQALKIDDYEMLYKIEHNPREFLIQTSNPYGFILLESLPETHNGIMERQKQWTHHRSICIDDMVSLGTDCLQIAMQTIVEIYPVVEFNYIVLPK